MTIEVEVGNIVQVVDDRNLVVIDQGNVVEVAAVGAQGPTGPQGPTGATGAQGPSGVVSVTAPITNSGSSTSAVIGVNMGTTSSTVASGDRGLPTGGTTGQVLRKTSGTDYADEWANPQLFGTAGRHLNTSAPRLDGTGLVLGGSTIINEGAELSDSNALDVLGDIDIKVKLTRQSWSGSWARMVAKWATGTPAYMFSFSATTQTLLLQWNEAGVTRSAESTVGVSFSAGATRWVRGTLDVDNGASQRVAKFYTSENGTTWTQLGTTVTTAGVTFISNSASRLSIGFRDGAVEPVVNSTIHRVIIQSAYDTANNTSNVVLDARFEDAPADALAFTESSTNAATVRLITSRYQYGVPGVQWAATSTQNILANTLDYQVFWVTAPITINMVVFRVTTAPSSSANVRCGIYAANDNYQPTGAPILDSGDITVGASVTGNFLTSVTPVTLQPGVYLSAIKSTVALTLQTARGGPTSLDITQGGSSIYFRFTIAQSGGAFPNPGAEWNNLAYASVPAQHSVFFRWNPA